MTEHVKTEVTAGIMTMTLARAEKKNALSNAMYSAMSDGLERAEKDPAVRVALFQGDGDSFTSGNDLADFSAQFATISARIVDRMSPPHVELRSMHRSQQTAAPLRRGRRDTCCSPANPSAPRLIVQFGENGDQPSLLAPRR
jgi:enoyl-CoA hydratase/carnithine racemase